MRWRDAFFCKDVEVCLRLRATVEMGFLNWKIFSEQSFTAHGKGEFEERRLVSSLFIND